MGLIFDLAVVIIGLLVIGSLALLAWTLAVSGVRAVKAERARVEVARRSVAEAEARVTAAAADSAAILAELTSQTRGAIDASLNLETDPHR